MRFTPSVGTRSVLFGAHCFLIHPWFVALAWWRLYGFRTVEDPHVGAVSLRDPRLWLAFVVHDLGYWGKPNMDGDEGELHPVWGARVMSRLFDAEDDRLLWLFDPGTNDTIDWVGPWGKFSLYHSRFLSKGHGTTYSLLCVADKLAVALEPWWLYLPRVVATGEIREYIGLVRDPSSKYGRESRRGPEFSNRREWAQRMMAYCRDWAFAHRDGGHDSWTPEAS